VSWQVTALMTGQKVDFGRGEQSAIAKQLVAGKIDVGREALGDDQQADRVHHGGPDMALHHYPVDHHSFWREIIGDHALLQEPGAFGSNIATTGLLEDDAWLGDRFRLGTALIEACQPRQPCWKIEHRFGQKGMVAKILGSGRCGWFYRVIEEGEAETGDLLERVSRGDPVWSMRAMFDALWGTSTPQDKGMLAQLASHELLPEKLRAKTLTRLGN